MSIFESGIAWKVFNDVEKEFVSFLEVIPLVPKHEKTYSFKLFNLILNVGSHIDNVFKAIGTYPKFQNNPNVKKVIKKPNITTYREAFEPIYNLSSKRVFVKSEPIYSIRTYYTKLIPFSGFKKKSPLWWTDYNKLKHEWFKEGMIDKANVKNTLRSLAALFILLVRHELSWDKLVDYGVILAGNFDESRVYDIKADIKKAFNEQKDIKQPSLPFPFLCLWAESRLFIYRYPFWQKWLTTKESIKHMKKWIYRQFYAPLKF